MATNGSGSEAQTAFVVAAAVLLGLPLIVSLGMAGLVMVASGGLLPDSAGSLTSESGFALMLFMVVWGVVAVVAVLIFVVRFLRRAGGSAL